MTGEGFAFTARSRSPYDPVNAGTPIEWKVVADGGISCAAILSSAKPTDWGGSG
jgi:hypothetical protein